MDHGNTLPLLIEVSYSHVVFISDYAVHPSALLGAILVARKCMKPIPANSTGLDFLYTSPISLSLDRAGNMHTGTQTFMEDIF